MPIVGYMHRRVCLRHMMVEQSKINEAMDSIPLCRCYYVHSERESQGAPPVNQARF